MTLQNFVLFALLSLSTRVSAQNKVFAFSEIQSRNEVQKWGKLQCIEPQLVHFTEEQINLKIDKKYHLTIISKTELPDNGTIYLCSDDKSNPVTVMLIDNTKMFFYCKSKRFQINFDPMQTTELIARAN